MGQRNGQGHVLLGFVAGVAEHHALIARALILVHDAVYALSDVGGLLVEADQHSAGVAVEAVLRAVVADFHDLAAHDLLDGHIGGGGDFAHDQHHAGGGGAFAGDVGVGILRENRVEDGIGNLVADFIRMTLGHGF